MQSLSNARSSSRLIASDRDGFGSGWRSTQASSFAFSAAGMRRPGDCWCQARTWLVAGTAGPDESATGIPEILSLDSMALVGG
jgi:hypothetical protein